ncbi:MAG TPA: hypothetical protein VGL06_18005 [Pseudonocardiaceae bacterium]
MSTSDVDSIIDQIQEPSRNLDSLPDVSDADMALMYMRHLRRRTAAA